jgi:hypothetical protein
MDNVKKKIININVIVQKIISLIIVKYIEHHVYLNHVKIMAYVLIIIIHLNVNVHLIIKVFIVKIKLIFVKQFQIQIFV